MFYIVNAGSFLSYTVTSEVLIQLNYLLFFIFSTATDIELADSTFSEVDFEIVSGMFNVKWVRIPPGTNVSHVVIVKPLHGGEFNFSSAVVQYVASEGAEPTVREIELHFSIV